MRQKQIIGYYSDSAFSTYLLVDIKYDIEDKIGIIRQIDATYSKLVWHKVYYTKCGYPYIICYKHKLFLMDFIRFDNKCFLQDKSNNPTLITVSTL